MLHRPEDLLDQTLLHLEYGKPAFGGVDWRSWLLRQGGETGSPCDGACGSTLTRWCCKQLRRAKVSPLGGAMSRTRSWRMGVWFAPWIERWKRRMDITCVHPRPAALTPEISAFLAWISAKHPVNLIFALPRGMRIMRNDCLNSARIPCLMA
jgi:hypothetical protein